MQFEKYSYAGDIQILARKTPNPPDAIPLTLDFTSVTDTDAHGKKIVKAGTPISKAGVAANTASAVGILRYDVTEDDPQGCILQGGYINKTLAETHSGVTYASAMMTALKNVIFE